MIYAIMLDAYQAKAGPNQYCVSFSGDLAACEAATDLPDGFEFWAKRDYGPPVFKETHALGPEPGKIYELDPISAFVLRAQSARASPPVRLFAVLGAASLTALVLAARLGRFLIKRAR